MAKQNVVAMLLAGGQGSRLGVLTRNIAKPAVPFGSRYRIIDFPLSNCTNSGIETVGVLTQYQPLVLNAYMGNGHPWDLDRNTGGLSILPPYQSMSKRDWYKGTANAIYQNIHFIDRYHPKYVLILSGDHIYKMDYRKMLNHHIEKQADATIAVFEVPLEEASRFGIMNTDKTGKILEFEEKPAFPKNNLASMGVYIFNWEVLRKSLIEDENTRGSANDFGKNIIPNLLQEGKSLYAYTFQGYWKDVGTILSLWEANMDIVDTPEALNLSDRSWRIYCRNAARPPHYIADGAVVEQSVFTDGDEIYGEVYHSVIATSVLVEEGAVVRDSILMPGAVVRKGARLERAIVGMDSVIGENCKMGPGQESDDSSYKSKLCSNGISVVEGGLEVRAGLVLSGNSVLSLPEDGHDTPDLKILNVLNWEGGSRC